MPFPLIPLIGLGGSILGSLFGNRRSRLERDISGKINPVMENLIHWSGQATDARKAFQPIAINDISKASGFYNRLLSGSGTQALDEILGPQRTAINDNYTNMIQNAARFGARGGGRTSGMMNFDWARNRELMELVPRARTMAAEGLLRTGGQAGSMALGFGNQAIDASSAVLGPALGGQASLAGQRQQAGQGWGQIGAQVGDLLGPLLRDVLNRRGGGQIYGAGSTWPE